MRPRILSGIEEEILLFLLLFSLLGALPHKTQHFLDLLRPLVILLKKKNVTDEFKQAAFAF